MGSFHQKIAGTPGEDLRVRGQVAVQEHGLQHLGGEGPWQTMADHGRPWQMETKQGRMFGIQSMKQ